MRHQSWELPEGTTIKGEVPIRGEALDMDGLTTGEVMVGSASGFLSESIYRT